MIRYLARRTSADNSGATTASLPRTPGTQPQRTDSSLPSPPLTAKAQQSLAGVSKNQGPQYGAQIEGLLFSRTPTKALSLRASDLQLLHKGKEPRTAPVPTSGDAEVLLRFRKMQDHMLPLHAFRWDSIPRPS